MITSDYLTLAQVQDELGVSERVVKQWLEDGVLRSAVKDGAPPLISRSSLMNITRVHDKLREQPTARELHERSLRLLVVDDDPDFLELVNLHSTSWPVPVSLTTASNGFEGLVLIGQTRPDVVVTDLCMPGMDGFQMLRRLRRAGSLYENLKFVVVTALGTADIEYKGGLPEGIDVLFKPLKMEKLMDAVCGVAPT